MTDDLNLLSAKQTAAILNISYNTFLRWKAKGIGPVGKVIGKGIWWTRGGIAEWENNLAKETKTLNPALG